MSKYILKRAALLLISCGVFWAIPGFSQNVRVCVWQGRHRPGNAVLENFRHRCRGSIAVRRAGGFYLLINTLGVEEYLYGVVGEEMGRDWPAEALKAQAVCARSMAYYYRENARRSGEPYDVGCSVLQQVYGGRAGESPAVREAVDATAGEVLTYDGQIVPAFYHACCGGHTSAAADVWPGSPPELVGVADPYCRGTPHYSWQKTFTGSELGAVAGTGPVEDVKILARDPAGRVETLALTTAGGVATVKGKDLRLDFLRSNLHAVFTDEILPSTLFSVRKSGDAFVFTGRGYGHGVGLCQWGARRMAEAGFDYQKILHYYFPLLLLQKEVE